MAGKEWSDDDFGGLPSVLVAAHELKTPLALIRQMALLLDDDLTIEADKKQIQQRIIQTLFFSWEYCMYAQIASDPAIRNSTKQPNVPTIQPLTDPCSLLYLIFIFSSIAYA